MNIVVETMRNMITINFQWLPLLLQKIWKLDILYYALFVFTGVFSLLLLWKKIKKKIIKHFDLCLAIVAFLPVPALLFGKLDFSAFVLLLTFYVLLWYSFETRGLKIAARRNNELQKEPFLVLLTEELNGRRQFILKNEGNGIAYNVTFNPVVFDKAEQIVDFNFNKSFCLAVGDMKKINFRIGWENHHTLDAGLENFIKVLFVDLFQGEQNRNIEKEIVLNYDSMVKRNDTQKFLFCVTDNHGNDFEIRPIPKI